MNEGKKTGIFWIAAALMLGVGGLVSYQPSGNQNDTEMPINEPLFADFKDPLTAATMKIVTFDEGQGTLGTFEVRKDRETGNWTIPSRDGYPADAVEQMKNAANSLVDLKCWTRSSLNRLITKTLVLSSRTSKRSTSAMKGSAAW